MNAIISFIPWVMFFLIIIFTIIIYNFLYKRYFFKFNLFKRSVILFFVWLISSILFSLMIWIYDLFFFNITVANVRFTNFFFAYGIEQILSLDNILIWFIIFEHFSIPIQYQKRILMYGTFMAFFLRMIVMILCSYFIFRWHWLVLIFGIILFFSGFEVLVLKNDHHHSVKKSFLLFLIMKLIKVTDSVSSNQFFIFKKNVLYFTPLFVALLMIEMSDIIFSIDSIPIIFSFVRNFYVVFTSNIFSILVLRSMYFILSNLLYKNNFVKRFFSLIIMYLSMKIIMLNYIYVLKNIYLIVVVLILVLFLMYNVVITKLLQLF
ncbi:TerC family protein [Buchnera aphidicola]|uniref:TerC family protein n=1 Tax=Buchnera aphidicola TaxID=9 RepID=UPI0031B812F0